MQNVFKIDGIYFNVRIPEDGIERSFSVADTDKTTRALSGQMIRDIIGTFYNYTIKLDTNELSLEEYDELYEIISAPTDSHVIEIPYGQSTLQFRGYITSGKDVLQTVRNGNTWTGLSVSIIAMKPQRKKGS